MNNTYPDANTNNLDQAYNSQFYDDFLHKFLTNEPEINNIINNASKDELEIFIQKLNEYSEEAFINQIFNDNNIKEVTLLANDIPCFSNFEHGIFRVSEILSFMPQGMGFKDLGYQLIQSKTPGAQLKYGENHAKLAAMMKLVTISEEKPIKVRITALSNQMLIYPLTIRSSLIKKLLFSNIFIQTILKSIYTKGFWSYSSCLSSISYKTAVRRQANTKQVLTFALSGSYLIQLMDCIDWRINI